MLTTVPSRSGQHHGAHRRTGSEEEPTDLVAPGRIRLDADLAGVESMAGMRFEKNGRGSTKETRKKRGQAGRNRILELHPRLRERAVEARGPSAADGTSVLRAPARSSHQNQP